MASNKELYKVLGVDESASDAEIKSAYERLIAQNPEGTPLHSSIVEAYTVLSDMDRRAAYDITGKTAWVCLLNGIHIGRRTASRETHIGRDGIIVKFISFVTSTNSTYYSRIQCRITCIAKQIFICNR